MRKEAQARREDVSQIGDAKNDAPRTTELLPLIALRTACLPVHFTRRLRDPALQGLVRQLRETTETRDRLSAEIADGLHETIGAHWNAPAHRNALISIRRAVHNQRLGAAVRKQVTDARPLLSPQLLDRVHAWMTAIERHRALCADVDWTTRVETVAREVFDDAAKTDLFARALAHHASQFWSTFGRVRGARPLRKASDRRTAISYLNRAAAKTSPLGTFTIWSIARASDAVDAPNPLRTLDNRIACAITQPLRLLLRTALYEQAFKLDDTEFQIAGICADDIARFSSGKLQPVNGGFWRVVDQNPQIAPDRSKDIKSLNGTFTIGRLADLCNRAGATPRAAIAYLVQTEAVQNEATERKLAEQLASFETVIEAVPAFPDMLLRLSDLRREYLGERFAAAATNLKEVECGAFQSVIGVYPATWIEPSEIEAALAGTLRVNPTYAALVDAFVEEFGADGSCTDIIGFLQRAAYHFRRLRPPAADRPRRAIELGRVGISVMAQFESGSGRTVFLNRTYPYPLWQSLRALPPAGDGSDMAVGAYCDWLRRIAGDAEPCEIAIGAQYNSLQHRPRKIVPRLAWGHDPGADGPSISDLVLELDPATWNFRLRNARGQAIALFYLGGLIPSATWGWEYLLTILSNPAWIRQPPTRIDQIDGDLSHRSARQVGRVVAERACWQVRSACIAALLSAPCPSNLLTLIAFWERHGLPHCFFIKAANHWQVPGGAPLGTDRKPQYAEIDNPLYLDLIAHIAGIAECVHITACQPALVGELQRVDGNHHVSEAVIELMLHNPDQATTLADGALEALA